MKYSYYAKNIGKDTVYSVRLKLAEKMGIDMYKTKSSRVYSYLMDAYLGIILN